MRVLITGAEGRVGSCLVDGLRHSHRVRGFDCVPMPDLEDSIVGDLADMQAVLTASRDMDAVIHLGAAAGSESLWEEVLASNVIGTYNVFEASRRNGVRRIAFASRAGLVAGYPREIVRTVDLAVRPGDYYTISKAFGENLGYMYAHRFDMEVACVRVGSFQSDRPDPEHPHHLGHSDAVRVFERAIRHPGVRFEIVFGVSDGSWTLYDLDHGRRAIGYDPRQKSDVQSPEKTA